MSINIRKAKCDDLNSLNSLFQKLLEYERENYDENIKENLNIDSYFNKKIKDVDNVILVAEVNKKIIGYIYGFIDSTNRIKLEPEAFISSIYIEEEYRSKGIGTKLIKTFINQIKKQNIKYVFIENFVENEVAKRLYSKLGFNIFKENRKLELGD